MPAPAEQSDPAMVRIGNGDDMDGRDGLSIMAGARTQEERRSLLLIPRQCPAFPVTKGKRDWGICGGFSRGEGVRVCFSLGSVCAQKGSQIRAAIHGFPFAPFLLCG